MGEITYLRDASETVELSTEQVIDRAANSNLAGAMVIGVRPDGTMYFETSIVDGSDTIWLLEKVRYLILSASFR